MTEKAKPKIAGARRQQKNGTVSSEPSVVAATSAPTPDPDPAQVPAASAAAPGPAPALAPVPVPAKPKGHHRFLRTLKAKMIAFGSLVVAAIAALIATGIVHAGSSAVHSALSHPAQSSAVPAVPFTVASSVAYGDCDAFALPAALDTGQNYALLISGSRFTDEGWAQFLDPLAGSPVGSVDIALTFAGVPAASARITDVEVKPVHVGNVDNGTFIPVPHQGGGDISYNFSVNLDDPNATLQGLNGQSDFPGFEINVNSTVSSTVNVLFSATKHDYSWIFVIDYDVNGVIKTMDVRRPDGKPFTLTGESPQYSEVFQYAGTGYEATNLHTPGV
jgi:hypothetical protein